MSSKGTAVAGQTLPENRKSTQANVLTKEGDKSLALEFSERGVRTGEDFAGLMSALMSDLIAGRVTPQVGNAVCNAGGKLLKVVEMKYKYGTPPEGTQRKKDLVLAERAGK